MQEERLSGLFQLSCYAHNRDCLRVPDLADLSMAACGSPCTDWSRMGEQLGTEGRTMVAFVVMCLVCRYGNVARQR